MRRLSRLTVLALGALLCLVAAGAIVLVSQGRDRGMVVKVASPSADELRAFGASRVFFAHQSVGANVIDGVDRTFQGSGSSGLVTITETRDVPPTEGGFLAHTSVGVNGDPYGKLSDFHAVLDGPLGSNLDVAVLKFCYADVVAGTDVDALFTAYSSTMADLERTHPSVRFLYATVPLTTDRGWKSTLKSWIGDDDHLGPADNLTRHRFNELVRRQFGSTGRLFDIAGVEATLSQDPTERRDGGEVYFVLNQVLAADAGHLNDLGASLAAAELIRVATSGSPR